VIGDDRIADERVANAVQRANHATIARGIAERFAKLSDQRGKTGLGDMNAGPERSVQLVVRHGVRLVPDEDQQQIERFRRKVHIDSLASHQASADVDDHRTHVRQYLADYTRA